MGLNALDSYHWSNCVSISHIGMEPAQLYASLNGTEIRINLLYRYGTEKLCQTFITKELKSINLLYRYGTSTFCAQIHFSTYIWGCQGIFLQKGAKMNVLI